MEICGRIHREVFRFADGAGSIHALNTGYNVVGPNLPGSLVPGVSYRFIGQWKEHKKYGQQFRYESFSIDPRLDRRSVICYLQTMLKGKFFGSVTAGKIFDEYGEQSLEVLRELPEKVAEDLRLSLQRVREWSEVLVKNMDIEKLRAEVLGLLAGYGFRKDVADHAIKLWGAKAPEYLRRDPFKLIVHRIPSCGFDRVDRMYIEHGGNPNKLKRHLFAVLHHCYRERSISTWITMEDFRHAIDKRLATDIKVGRVIKLGVRSGRLSVRQTVEGEVVKFWFAPSERHFQESDAVFHMERLVKGTRSTAFWPARESILPVNGKVPTEHQLDAVELISNSKVAILTGGPGTGKTFTVGAIVKELLRKPSNCDAISITTPTGKAASRLTEVLREYGVNARVTTQHSKLAGRRDPADGSRWIFDVGEDNKSRETWHIIDESFMQGMPIFSAHLKSIPDHARILWVGDPNQLRPVDHGQPLIDLIAAGIPHAHLSELHRYAGRIAHVCKAINDGEDWQPSSNVDLNAESPENLRHIECRAGGESLSVLRTVLKRLQDNRNFDLYDDVQILCVNNEEAACSRDAVNKAVRDIINPNNSNAGLKFGLHDKVICTHNLWLPYLAKDAQAWETPEDEFIANGEIGKVTSINTEKMVVTCRFGKYLVPRDVWGDFEHANGITFHKSQGSQWPVVICMIDDSYQANMVACKELWYTGLSRAAQLCFTIGPMKELRKQCQRDVNALRKTFFKEDMITILNPPSALSLS